MSIPVATDAVVDPGNPFFPVFGNYVCRLMLVAAVASVLLIIASHVTCRAGRIVVSIQGEEASVIECCRFPGGRLMAG